MNVSYAVVWLLLCAAALSPIPIQQWIYYREDKAWNRFVAYWAEAAKRGDDMSIILDCPNLNELAKQGRWEQR